ncbi:MAG: hypothetical protein WC783_02960 [Candidatus Paceibacterota bacterium]|jgi:oligoribonuclease (3'-5' exoribonuclease)
MKYVSLDIETTGLDTDKCQILEVAMVYDDLDDPKPLDQLACFHTLVTHKRYKGEAYALWLNNRIFERLKNKNYETFKEQLKYGTFECEYTPIDDLAFDMAHWFTFNKIDKVTIAGKNVGSFDMQFIKKLNGYSRIQQYIYYQYLDVGALYFDINKDTKIPSLDGCFLKADIKNTVTHNALEDALDVVTLIRKLKGIDDNIPF